MSVEAESPSRQSVRSWWAPWTTLSIEEMMLPFLLIPAVALAGWMLAVRRFDGLYGQDPYAYLSYAVGPLRAGLLHGSPLTTSFVPLGYPFLAAVASLVVGPDAAAGQLVSGLAAVLAVLVCYLFTRDALRMLGTRTDEATLAAIIGALVLATSGFFIQLGLTDMSDATALVCTLGSAWTLMRWVQSSGTGRRYLWLAISSASLAYAVISWWGDGVLAFVWLLVTVPMLVSSPWRDRVRTVVAGGLPAAAIIGVQLYFAVTVPAGDVRPLAFLGNFSLQGDSWTFINLFSHAFHNSDGYLHYSLPNIVFYLSEPFRFEYLTPVFAVPVLIALVELGKFVWLHDQRQRACHLQIVLVFIGWPGALLLFDSGLPWQDPRWVLAALPPIAGLAGYGSVRLGTLLGSRWPLLFPLAISFGILLIAVGAGRDLNRVASAQHEEIATIAWLESRLPTGSSVLTTEITPGIQFRTSQHAIELYGLTKPELKRTVSGARHLYLFVNVHHLTTQFAGLDPGKDYRYLARTGSLKKIGAYGGYSLFTVTAATASVP